MKTSEVIVGHTYAIGTPAYPWSWQRGTVVSLGAGGIARVRWANNGAEVACPTRKINKLWDEHEQVQAEATRREQQRRAGLERIASDANEAAAWLYDHVDIKTLPYFATRMDCAPHGDGSGVTGAKGEITTVQIKRIVESAIARIVTYQEA